MSELRQKFEELPDIKGIIYGSDFGFNESLNQYYHPDHTNHRLNYAFIMGAWCAFQSQQAEIDLLKRLIEIKDRVRDEQQAQIDELEKQNQKLQKQFNFLLDKNIRDESAHASLKLRVMSVSHLMDKAAEDGTECVDIGSLYDVLIKDGDLDQALRGANG